MKQNTLFSRILSWMLTASLLSSVIFMTSITALAEETTGDTASPGITIAAVGIDGGKYLEVGLSIQSGSSPFQSAGTILEYDPEILTPMNWDNEQTVTVGAISETNPEYWDKATVLPTKGSDQTAGKTAMAYLSADKSKGYLYLSAEAAKTMERFNQTLPEEAATPSAIGATGKAGIPTKTIDSAGTPVEQVVTVRFQVNGDKAATDGAIYTIDAALRALDLVQDKTAANIASADPNLATSPVYTTTGAIYMASNDTAKLLTEQARPEVSFLLVKQGQTVNSGSGGGDASDFATIVFYDWDETLLGSVVVPKNVSEEEIEKTLKDFANTKKADSQKESDYDTKVDAYGYYSSLDDQTGIDHGEKYPLTYKKAYRFEDVWLDKEAAAFECYKDADIIYSRDPANHKLLSEYTEQEHPSNSQIMSKLKEEGEISLKAAYKAEANVNPGGSFYYTCGNYTYNRYGNTLANNGNFSISVEVTRGYAARLFRPAVKVQMLPNTGLQIWSLIQLDPTDQAYFEVVPTRSIKQVTFNIIDRYSNFIEISNWTAAEVKSSNYIFDNVEGNLYPDIIREGTIGFINQQGRLEIEKISNPAITTEWNRVNQVAFNDIGLSHKTNLNDSKKSIINAMKKDQSYFTKIKLQNAIDSVAP